MDQQALFGAPDVMRPPDATAAVTQQELPVLVPRISRAQRRAERKAADDFRAWSALLAELAAD